MPDLREWKYTCIPIVLQCALADVEQPAHITVVQPIGVPALFSECLELIRSLNNFVLGNKTKHIMKNNADKSKEIHRQQEA